MLSSTTSMFFPLISLIYYAVELRAICMKYPNGYNDFMRILFVADGRSPIAQNWIHYFVDRGDEVYLASTFQCELGFAVKQLAFTPVAFSTVKRQGARAGGVSSRGL